MRGGFIRQLQAGVYDFLPLGWRTMRKVMEIVREEMVAAGATEVFLPVLQPIDLWDKSGRNAIYGDDMLRSKDRKGATNALAPTHEECGDGADRGLRQFVQATAAEPVPDPDQVPRRAAAAVGPACASASSS